MYIAVLFYYNSFLTVLVLASIPLYVVLSMIVTPLFRHRLNEKFRTGSEVSSYLVESIQGVQTIKSYALENKIQDRWGQLQANYVTSSYKINLLSSSSSGVAQFIQKIFDLTLLYFGAKLVLEGQFSIGQLVAFRMLSSRISGPVLRLVQLWQEYQQANLSVEKIGDIINSPVEIKDEMGQKLQLPELKGKINFDKVHFRYRLDASEAVKDLSFSIEAGTVVGLVGRSGSGKSTVAKLIQKLYIPERGKVSIDGMDVSLMNADQLRRQIGVVLQENFMFTGSVRENIAIRGDYASMEEIMAAAKIAGAHDFILQLPNGYDTIIGEKGLGLSGGQKQRIAIARAILPNPKILLFDEATSALDYESESIIQENLKEICKGRTVMIIAHRLSTLRDAQKIMVLDQGSILEQGSHEELLRADGLYASFYHQQNRLVSI